MPRATFNVIIEKVISAVKVRLTRSDTGAAMGESAASPVYVSGAGSGAGPLPVGASTAAKQDAQTALLTTIDADTGNIATNTASLAAEDFSTETTLVALNALVTTLNSLVTAIKDTDGIKKITDAVAVTGTFWQATQPVSATNLDIRDLASTQDSVAVTTVKPDGTNTMPSGDAVTRPIFTRIGDGTNNLSILKSGDAAATAYGTILGGLNSANNFTYLNIVPGNADGYAASANLLAVQARLCAFNGTTYDRLDSVNTGTLKVAMYDASGNAMPAGDAEARPIYTRETHSEVFDINLDAQAVAANTGFMIIDLSNTAVWPHTNTNVIHIDCIGININGDTAYRGDIYIGFLSSVDATNGDLNIVKTYHMDQDVTNYAEHISLQPPIVCNTTNWFGRTVANDTLWQTDVNLQGPNDAVAPAAQSYPSGDGDLVLWIARTAGTVDVNINIRYHTE